MAPVICQAASEHFVLKADELEAGQMGKHKDVRDFDKGHIVMARQRDHLQNCSSCGVNQSKVVQESTTGEPGTGSWAAKAH